MTKKKKRHTLTAVILVAVLALGSVVLFAGCDGSDLFDRIAGWIKKDDPATDDPGKPKEIMPVVFTKEYTIKGLSGTYMAKTTARLFVGETEYPLTETVLTFTDVPCNGSLLTTFHIKAQMSDIHEEYYFTNNLNATVQFTDLTDASDDELTLPVKYYFNGQAYSAGKAGETVAVNKANGAKAYRLYSELLDTDEDVMTFEIYAPVKEGASVSFTVGRFGIAIGDYSRQTSM